ncbi:HAD family phosphatase [Fulvivirgaceae bacterium PWU4]|uniref:HAD family phosphatase n=1 Tax=Chryseosolibacter histidini TaxID=2782349 RepID=A0AAP2GM72_9BACT|nr:HAD family phosphatase [Chryseosolibacter histidini]MBT1701211.1 HAD family phosphatase [Chryseosolibacter histidini]
MPQKIETVIFDLGGVLIDWNPRYLYRKILKDEEQVNWFLQNICTSEWNDEQDAGRSFEEATRELIRKHPGWEEAITAWYGRWQETISGPIQETVEILEAIKKSNGYRLYALTNWSAETFPWALDNFKFLHWFEGIVVSGVEKTRKPFPEFYQILFDRYKIDPSKAIFIDDNIKNIEGARKIGLPAIQFQNPQQLRAHLTQIGLLN